MKNFKKILAVMFAVIITLSFCVGAFAADTKTETLINSIKNGKELSVTFTAGNTFLGTSTDTVSVKGNTVAYEYKTGFLTARVIVKDGTAYAYLPLLPFFYVQVDSLGFTDLDVWTLLDKVSGVTFAVLDYQKSYTGEVNGKTYYIEEYNDRAQVTSKFCYEGDTLKLLNVYDARTLSTQNTYFENISFTVPDSAIAVPTGLNLTPFLKGLFTSILASLIS